jgi:DNA mismatch repair ATPase MutS
MICILSSSIVFARVLRRRVLSVLGAVEEPQRELKVLRLALERLERERFQSPKLAAVQAALRKEGQLSSEEIRKFLRLTVLIDSQRNQFFRPISYILMWGTQLAYAIEDWRRRNGPEVPRWLAAVGELEALCALSGYAYEHPGDPFPEIADAPPLLDAREVRHPLLPSDQCVPNSVKLGGELQLFVVSGSNMSGKSTLLRTLGVNVALALAGAPVRARSFRVSPVNMGATLRVQDSLQTGTSRFYAEIQRLRQIVDMTAGPLPVLFLLDEILHGTNSHDRAIGAEGILRGLIDQGAIGLVTTHDLALARAAEALAPRAANIHFEDHLENGKMIFDYTLRPGVVQKSNALELMRTVGLKV